MYHIYIIVYGSHIDIILVKAIMCARTPMHTYMHRAAHIHRILTTTQAHTRSHKIRVLVAGHRHGGLVCVCERECVCLAGIAGRRREAI